MATLSPDRTADRWKINYFSPKLGGRTGMGIGNITGFKRVGQRFRDKVLRILNELEEAHFCGENPSSKTLTDIAGLSEKFQKKIEVTGLVPRKVFVDLNTLHKEWLQSCENRVRVSTLKAYKAHTRHLVEYLGKNRSVGTLSSFDVDEFPDYLIDEKGLSGGTPCTIITECRTMFKFAVRRGYLERNPMEGVKANPFEYAEPIMISEEHRERLLAAARNDEERLW